MNWPAAGKLFSALPDPDIIQKTSPDPATNHYPKELTEGNDDDPTMDVDPYRNIGKGTLDDFDNAGNVWFSSLGK